MSSEKKSRKRDSPFARNLLALLKEHKISQRELAAKLNVRATVVNAWTAGARPTDLTPIVKLCQIFDCDFQQLLTGFRSDAKSRELKVSDFFDVEGEPSVSGLFLIEARRLKRRGHIKE